MTFLEFNDDLLNYLKEEKIKYNQYPFTLREFVIQLYLREHISSKQIIDIITLSQKYGIEMQLSRLGLRFKEKKN